MGGMHEERIHNLNFSPNVIKVTKAMKKSGILK
jgi:hypothetical protein